MQGQPGPWCHKWLAGSDRNERIKQIKYILRGVGDSAQSLIGRGE